MSMTKPPITIKALYICHQCQTKSDAAVSVCQTVLGSCVCGTALCPLYRADRLLPHKTRLQKPGTVEHGKNLLFGRETGGDGYARAPLSVAYPSSSGAPVVRTALI